MPFPRTSPTPFVAPSRTHYTLEQIRAAALRPTERDALAEYATNPDLLMRDAGFAPDLWQSEFLASREQFNLMLCARQVGKSLTVSILALHALLTQPGNLTIIVAQRQEQAAELLRKTVTAFYKVGSPLPVLRSGTTHFELQNGSRILALPGVEEAMHGPTANLLIIDEAARVPDSVFNAASPQLSASKGRLVALSTAFSKSGWFYREWTEGAGYRRWSITARECPRHTPEFLEGERKRMGDLFFQMAYMNVFGDDIMAVFSTDDIRRATERGAGVAPLFGVAGIPATAPPAGDAGVTPLFVVG